MCACPGPCSAPFVSGSATPRAPSRAKSAASGAGAATRMHRAFQSTLAASTAAANIQRTNRAALPGRFSAKPPSSSPPQITPRRTIKCWKARTAVNNFDKRGSAAMVKGRSFRDAVAGGDPSALATAPLPLTSGPPVSSSTTVSSELPLDMLAFKADPIEGRDDGRTSCDNSCSACVPAG